MRIEIDTEAGSLTVDDGGTQKRMGLYTPDAFSVLSHQWVRVGWSLKYGYGFSWMGRPIIQLPEDIVRMQEVIYAVRPDVIVETGVAHGGSLIFYASLFKAMGRGRVIGVDIEIRPQNRRAIETHELSSYITLIEGSSVDPAVVEDVRGRIRPDERVMVVLDSDHSKRHVLAELEAYHGLVSDGSYIVATDGAMMYFSDIPRGRPEWVVDNPEAAARDFAASHPQFQLAPPRWPFNESELSQVVTHWPGAWLRKDAQTGSERP